MVGNDAGAAIKEWVTAARNTGGDGDGPMLLATTPEETAGVDVLFFAWELSYFSGKVRGYLRYKQRVAGLRYEEILATPELVKEVLVPHTKSSAVPQCQLPSGEIVQDSTEIIQRIEALFPAGAVVPDLAFRPRQRIACELLELFGDEWLLVAAYHWRWAYSGDGSRSQTLPAAAGSTKTDATARATAYLPPEQRDFNAQQWGDFLLPSAIPTARREAGKMLFDRLMYTGGPKRGLRALGVFSDELASAWEGACMHFLGLFEKHLGLNDFVLGGRPSSADFALLGPLYAHLYRDPVPSFLLRTRFPLVAQWCERVHDRGGAQLAARYTFDAETRSLKAAGGGGAHGRDDSDEWCAADGIPETLIAMLKPFFQEMWPVLQSTAHVITGYLSTHAVKRGKPLPSKSFGPSDKEQTGPHGALTHAFSLPLYKAGPAATVQGRRMVIPYQLWLLQRLQAAVDGAVAVGSGEPVEAMLRLAGGAEAAAQAMQLRETLDGCRVVKVGGNIYAASQRSRL